MLPSMRGLGDARVDETEMRNVKRHRGDEAAESNILNDNFHLLLDSRRLDLVYNAACHATQTTFFSLISMSPQIEPASGLRGTKSQEHTSGEPQ